MNTLVVFESMYGNTHTIAERIAAGFSPLPVTVRAASQVTDADVAAAHVLVLGAPTHVHHLPSLKSRWQAVTHPPSGARLDSAAFGAGMRDVLRSMATWGAGDHQMVAAFDTRLSGPAVLTGRASRSIARRVRRLGRPLVVAPMSFIVDRANHLAEGEAERAERWGASIAAAVRDLRLATAVVPV